jgi:hypothetical protein
MTKDRRDLKRRSWTFLSYEEHHTRVHQAVTVAGSREGDAAVPQIATIWLV